MKFAHRSSLLFMASAVALSFAACGGGDDGGDAPPTKFEGTHYKYVVKRMLLPADANTPYKLDIDGNGGTENALGKVLAALASQSKGALNLQESLDKGVNKADIVLLADLQTKDLVKASNVGLKVYLGDEPMPAPCLVPTDDTTCGQHLKGTGSFIIGEGSDRDAAVGGAITGGTFRGGPGKMTLQLVLEGKAIKLSLINAKAQFTGVSATGMSGIVGGAISQEELNTNVLPAVADTISGVVGKDCKTPTAMDCGCPAGNSTGKTLLGLFDKDPVNCQVSLDEVKNSSFIKTLLGSDLDINPKDGKNDALSVGVGIELIGAMYND